METFSEALNKVLQKKKWFNTERYPEIHFISSKIIPYNKNKAKVHGWLTFLGVKKFAKLDVTFNKAGKHLKTGKFIAGFSANTKIDRTKFNMKGGLPFIDKNVKIIIEAEGIKN